MMSEVAPPSYSSSAAPALDSAQNQSRNLPAYTIPTSFTIGGRATDAPLVTTTELKGHLALLDAFADLRTRVEETWTHPIIPTTPTENLKDRRWAAFVALGVERFERWCKTCERNTLLLVPPLDVVLVWHAYLLNPGWYKEDILRLYTLQGIGKISQLTFEHILKVAGEAGLWNEPSAERSHSWVQETQTPFDPFESANTMIQREIVCPSCNHTFVTDLINASGTGYCQSQFSGPCPQCKFNVTKEALAIARFVSDLADTARYLPGTVCTPTKDDTDRAKSIKAMLLRAPRLQPAKDSTVSQWKTKMRDASQYRFARMKAIAQQRMPGRLINRIMSAYADDKDFSLDLVGAVLRQNSFTTKMRDLGWTQPTFFEAQEEELALHHAIARYHAFLDLMSSSPASFFVPTLDIDLAWHTHQLFPSRYDQDCKLYIRRFIDHDDKVEENHLAQSFDLTCRAWQSRFGVRYIHCGCPLPGETIGQKLSHLVRSHREQPSYLVPPENQDDLLAATHPSDHNSIFLGHKPDVSERMRRKRQEKIAKRHARELASGKLTPAQLSRSNGHNAAFLTAVPYYYYMPLAGCAGWTGNIVNSGSCGGAGCAAGTGGTCGGGGACGGAAGGCGGGGGNCGGGGGGCGGGGGGGCGGGGGGGGGCGGS